MNPCEIFAVFFAACTTAAERQKLYEVLSTGWSEYDLAEFARHHFSAPLGWLRPPGLIAIINSALYRDFFARRFLKQQRKQRTKARSRVLNHTNQQRN